VAPRPRYRMTSPNQLFVKIVLPLALPALAVTGFLVFNVGWTEFDLSWMFLTNPKSFTLAKPGRYFLTSPYRRTAPSQAQILTGGIYD
jgi:arabinogalactan oligomer / maltooligosaccharide transport system permease protein